MTLHEARHTLEVANPRDAAIRQAIRVVLANLPDDVKLSESDDCVIVKDGYVYHLTKEAI